MGYIWREDTQRHMEWGDLRRRDTHGERIYTERGHTRRKDRWERDTQSGDIYRVGTHTK